jgi:mannose-6-phosphate isomerase-like protein (cupin superfamily)
MMDNHAPRMRARDYERYLDMATIAHSPDAVARLRTELRERWADDPWARDLSETLYAYQLSLSEAVESIAASAGGVSRSGAPRRPSGPADERSGAPFTHGGLLIRLYSPHDDGYHAAHPSDAIYVVAQGSGTFCDRDSRRRVTAGDLLFTAAGTAHRFETCTHDFAAWLISVGSAPEERAAPRTGSTSVLQPSTAPPSTRGTPATPRRSVARTAGARATSAALSPGRR